jgi:hypothetical protein
MICNASTISAQKESNVAAGDENAFVLVICISNTTESGRPLVGRLSYSEDGVKPELSDGKVIVHVRVDPPQRFTQRRFGHLVAIASRRHTIP